MATAREIINDALKQIGALAVGETATAEEADDALGVLNDMLDMWSTESLLVYYIEQNVFPFVAGKANYTLGTGGDFNIERPVHIQDAYVRDQQGNDYKLIVTTNSQDYSDLIAKYVTSSIPTLLYDNGNFPLKNLSLWPVPSDGSYSCVLWTWKLLAQFDSLNTDVQLPPGYKIAIQNNLAFLLCPRYGITNIVEIEKAATRTKGQVKRINFNAPTMAFPTSLTGNSVAFNWLTGQPT